jgi:hypothetical protein
MTERSAKAHPARIEIWIERRQHPLTRDGSGFRRRRLLRTDPAIVVALLALTSDFCAATC